MNAKATNLILPFLVSALIGLVVYIYQDFKNDNKANIQEIRNLICVIQNNQVESKVKEEGILFVIKNHETRITKLEK